MAKGHADPRTAIRQQEFRRSNARGFLLTAIAGCSGRHRHGRRAALCAKGLPSGWRRTPCGMGPASCCVTSSSASGSASPKARASASGHCPDGPTAGRAGQRKHDGSTGRADHPAGVTWPGRSGRSTAGAGPAGSRRADGRPSQARAASSGLVGWMPAGQRRRERARDQDPPHDLDPVLSASGSSSRSSARPAQRPCRGQNLDPRIGSQVCRPIPHRTPATRQTPCQGSAGSRSTRVSKTAPSERLESAERDCSCDRRSSRFTASPSASEPTTVAARPCHIT